MGSPTLNPPDAVARWHALGAVIRALPYGTPDMQRLTQLAGPYSTRIADIQWLEKQRREFSQVRPLDGYWGDEKSKGEKVLGAKKTEAVLKKAIDACKHSGSSVGDGLDRHRAAAWCAMETVIEQVIDPVREHPLILQGISLLVGPDPRVFADLPSLIGARNQVDKRRPDEEQTGLGWEDSFKQRMQEVGNLLEALKPFVYAPPDPVALRSDRPRDAVGMYSWLTGYRKALTDMYSEKDPRSDDINGGAINFKEAGIRAAWAQSGEHDDAWPAMTKEEVDKRYGSITQAIKHLSKTDEFGFLARLQEVSQGSWSQSGFPVENRGGQYPSQGSQNETFKDIGRVLEASEVHRLIASDFSPSGPRLELG